MKIGKLYQTKKLYWLLYPSKDIAALHLDPGAFTTTTATTTFSAAAASAYYSKCFNCNVSYISPKSIFVFLEKDEKVIKILTTNGEVGWIILSDYKHDIEEVNQ